MRQSRAAFDELYAGCVEPESRTPAIEPMLMIEPPVPLEPDTSWPDTQARADEVLRGLPEEEIRQISHANTAAVYRHPVPVSPEWAR